MFEFEQPSDEAPEETPIPEEQPVRRQRRQRPERRPAAEEPVGADGKRRKPMSPMRRFKNEQLPKIILGVTAVLMAIFIIGSVSRAISTHLQNKDNQVDASNEAKTKEQMELEQRLDESWERDVSEGRWTIRAGAVTLTQGETSRTAVYDAAADTLTLEGMSFTRK